MNTYEEYLMIKEAKINKDLVLESAKRSGLAGAAVYGTLGAAKSGYNALKYDKGNVLLHALKGGAREAVSGGLNSAALGAGFNVYRQMTD